MAMTARQVWEGMLTELSKTNAPAILLTDFNYFFNKAINQYVNKSYNIYDSSQQTTDDLRVLKSQAFIPATKVSTADNIEDNDLKAALQSGAGSSKLLGGFYEVILPLDYLHLLNCTCIYKLKERFKCYDKGNILEISAKRLTGDTWSTVLNNYWVRPQPERPYFYIHNVNTFLDLPTNPINNTSILDRTVTGTDSSNDYKIEGGGEDGTDASNLTITGNLPRQIDLKNITNNSVVEREAGVRYGNSTNVRMEIRYGRDDSVFELIGVSIDYIKSPQTIRLTQEQIDLTKDTSQIMEFPDYVCQEIINELTKIVMENVADPRLQTYIPVSQSIAQPAQQQAQQPQQRG